MWVDFSYCIFEWVDFFYLLVIIISFFIKKIGKINLNSYSSFGNQRRPIILFLPPLLENFSCCLFFFSSFHLNGMTINKSCTSSISQISFYNCIWPVGIFLLSHNLVFKSNLHLILFDGFCLSEVSEIVCLLSVERTAISSWADSPFIATKNQASCIRCQGIWF